MQLHFKRFETFMQTLYFSIDRSSTVSKKTLKTCHQACFCQIINKKELDIYLTLYSKKKRIFKELVAFANQHLMYYYFARNE